MCTYSDIKRAASVGLGAILLAVFAGGRIRAEQVKLNVALAHPVLKAGQKNTTFLKVGLTGFRFERESDRAPVNLAIVIDTSGSMTGEKIQRAREAAIFAIRKLSARDIASVVAYSDTVRVLVPATKITDPDAVCLEIRRLEASGSTALFAGVAKGAGEVRKFLDKNKVNRVILISDGIANIGPSTPAELGDLGASLAKEGISVATIGLGTGYNEDLMRSLAQKSDGNHYFVENSADLERIFRRELGEVLAVAAQEIAIEVRCADGVRLVKALAPEVEIAGGRAVACWNQLCSEQHRYLILEIEVPATPAGRTIPIAKVEVSYMNLQTKTTDVLTSAVSARFSEADSEVETAIDKEILALAVEQIARIKNELAMKLRDAGKVEEARALLYENVRYLTENAAKLGSQRLEEYRQVQAVDAENVMDPKLYELRRKAMVQEQHSRARGQ